MDPALVECGRLDDSSRDIESLRDLVESGPDDSSADLN
jgi:hypothetical protein